MINWKLFFYRAITFTHHKKCYVLHEVYHFILKLIFDCHPTWICFEITLYYKKIVFNYLQIAGWKFNRHFWNFFSPLFCLDDLFLYQYEKIFYLQLFSHDQFCFLLHVWVLYADLSWHHYHILLHIFGKDMSIPFRFLKLSCDSSFFTC